MKRNNKRFPADFMFRVNADEIAALNRSQFVTGSSKHRDPQFPPHAFTEHGAILARTGLAALMIDPALQSTSYGCDANDNLTQVTDPKVLFQ